MVTGFTFQYPYLNAGHSDIVLGKLLCEELDIFHNTVEVMSAHSAEQELLNQIGDSTLVNSNIADIFRVFYRLPDFAQTPLFMYKFENMVRHPIVLRELERWFVECVDFSVEERFDLFYWEQRLAKWASVGFAGSDVILKKVNLYNIRALYLLMREVSWRERKTGRFQCNVIRQLSPRLCEFPLNPSENLMSYIKSKLKNSNVAPIVQYLNVMARRS